MYKYSAIIKTMMLHIQAKAPHMRLSTAASAVGGASTSWWGGNLKGVWYFANLWYPSIIDFLSKGANAGGINVMTYDLSDNPEFHECPEVRTAEGRSGGLQLEPPRVAFWTAILPAASP